MCVFELLAEFIEWIGSSNYYTMTERKKNLSKFQCNLVISIIAYVWLIFISVSSFQTDIHYLCLFYLYSVLFYTLIVDIIFYIFRYLSLNRSNNTKEPHLFLFLHMLVHEIFVGCICYELYVAFSPGSYSSKMRDEMSKITI